MERELVCSQRHGEVVVCCMEQRQMVIHDARVLIFVTQTMYGVLCDPDIVHVKCTICSVSKWMRCVNTLDHVARGGNFLTMRAGAHTVWRTLSMESKILTFESISVLLPVPGRVAWVRHVFRKRTVCGAGWEAVAMPSNPFVRDAFSWMCQPLLFFVNETK